MTPMTNMTPMGETFEALHCQMCAIYFTYNWIFFFFRIYYHIDRVGCVKFVERISRHHKTHRKTALKHISPIQDHFLMSWVKKKLFILIWVLKMHLNLDGHFLFSTKVPFQNHLTPPPHPLTQTLHLKWPPL
jgi:hypothetical protein